jgi:DMSO/TMAO reductase YedYZ molybdopterin-dependent catalytic subunit
LRDLYADHPGVGVALVLCRYPVRVVLPGYVGGRMVKWLSKIEITAEESTNWHHYHGTKPACNPM